MADKVKHSGAPKQGKAPRADLVGLSAAVQAAVALATASGEPVPKELARSFHALPLAELMTVTPLSPSEEAAVKQ